MHENYHQTVNLFDRLCSYDLILKVFGDGDESVFSLRPTEKVTGVVRQKLECHIATQGNVCTNCARKTDVMQKGITQAE